MENPEGSDSEPRPIGEILTDLPAVLENSPDPERAKKVTVTGLQSEVDELTAARQGMIEANMSGVASHDVTDINDAMLRAQADLAAARDRHPSKPR